MPNGIDWEEVSGDKDHPLAKIKPVLENFAKLNQLKLYYSTYHDGLDVELSMRYFSKQNKYYIAKAIRMGLVENQNKLSCSMSVYVSTYYGFRELIFFVPFLRNLRKKWLRKKWSQWVGNLDLPIDLQKLQNLLSQAKQILGNFDESQLQEIK